MVPTSLIEKLKTIYNIISSNPFFFIALIITIILLILIIIGLVKYKKINLKLFVIIWLIITIAIAIKYYKFILALGDSLIENILMAIYFPNLAIFTITLIITNVFLFYNIIKKDVNMIYKSIQIPSAILINFLFVLILDTVVTNNINIYSQTEVYQNNDLYVLLETSMLIFTINVILTLMIFMIKKLLKNNTKKSTNNINVEQTLPTNNPIIEKPIPNLNESSINNTNMQLNNNITPIESIIPKPIENMNITNSVQPSMSNLTTPINNQVSILQQQPYQQPIINNQQPAINNQMQQINNQNNLYQTTTYQTNFTQSNSQNDDIEIL